jgi:hypothetical protein
MRRDLITIKGIENPLKKGLEVWYRTRTRPSKETSYGTG